MLFQPTDPTEAARRTLAYLNRSCFVHHLANATPMPNLRISPRDDLGLFHRRLEQLVLSLSGSFVIDSADWHGAIASAIAHRMKFLIQEIERRNNLGTCHAEHSGELRTLRTIFAVLNTVRYVRKS